MISPRDAPFLPGACPPPLAPEFAMVLASSRRIPPRYTEANLDKIRAESQRVTDRAPSAGVIRTELSLPGDPPVPVRVHTPAEAGGPRPAIVGMHAGGYIGGAAARDDDRFDEWCLTFNCVGIAVDYRLAPAARYPAALEDCYAALRWTHEHAAELGVDVRRVGAYGASAGGGLAAALGLMARDRGELRVGFQLLLYPCLDDRQVTASSRWETPVWPPAANALGWRSYLGPLYDGPDVPGYAAPARATDLRGLPPAYLMVGALDGFHDECVGFATRLTHAGVATDLHVYAGAPHAFDRLAPNATVTRRAHRDMTEWLAAQFG